MFVRNGLRSIASNNKSFLKYFRFIGSKPNPSIKSIDELKKFNNPQDIKSEKFNNPQDIKLEKFNNPQDIKSKKFNNAEDIKSKKKIQQKSVTIEEKSKGKLEKIEFKAKTQEILKIVSQSIYTNKEIFIRELISNASDATEQLRYLMQKNPNDYQTKHSLEIRIFTDIPNNRIIIQDNGIGMTKQQLIDNLGTIAKSGSKKFMETLKKNSNTTSSNIIGQFGVGFYSSFMVSSDIEVYTKSSNQGSTGYYWTSNGKGEFSISKADNVKQGTKIIVNLSKGYEEFTDSFTIEKIIKRYSNFVEFPIYLNDKRMNLHGALWLENPLSITKERYSDFFKHLVNAYDNPMKYLHFHKDFPISMHGLLFVPKYHSEKYGNARMKPGVDLYCRKILIKRQSNDILPDWLRFIKGVVDSEDLNLNISRESTQNVQTLRKIKRVLVKTIIADLKTTARRDLPLYNEFYKEYKVFLKEGICSDAEFKDICAPLLRFDTSVVAEKEKKILDKKEKSNEEITKLEKMKKMVEDEDYIEARTFDDYISSMPSEQKKIYYLVTTNRQTALRSPYYESLKKAGREVIFLYSPIDEFVMSAISVYEKRPIVSIESDNVDDKDMAKFESEKGEFFLKKDEIDELCDYMKSKLGNRVKKVIPTLRLEDSPAIVTGHENSSVQIMMQMANEGNEYKTPPQTLEINPSHRVLRGLYYNISERGSLAENVTELILDNALIEAGLLKNPRGILKRMNEVMANALDVDGVELELRENKSNVKGVVVENKK